MLELHWAAAPSSLRLLLFYLCLVLIWVVSRALRLVRRSYSLGKPVSLDDLRAHSNNPDAFAARAFANRVNLRSIAAGSDKLDKSINTAGNEAVFQGLRAADTKFRFILASSEIETDEIKRVLWITALLSSFVFVFSAFPTWREFFENSNLTALEALVKAMSRLFDWASLALATCTILYAIWVFLIGTLRRRQVCWQYFYSRTSSELSSDGWKSDTLQAPPEK